METNTYKKQLTYAGLTDEQALIYEILLDNGNVQAGRLSILSGLKRPLVYKILEQLLEMDLAEKTDTEKVARFNPKHPARLKEIIEERKQKLKGASASIDGVIGDMVSKFNLISGKPNVQFFEGRKGMERVLDDTLQTDSEILQYGDFEMIMKYIPEVNEEYVKKREKKGITKRIIVPDTEYNRKGLSEHYSDTSNFRMLPIGSTKFETQIYLYDNKISYVTLRPDSMIGVIITSESIYNSQKAIFEHLWKNLNTQDGTTTR